MARTSLWLLLCACLSQVSWAATVRKSLRLTWGEGAPNGRSREMIFINGQFPGPNLIFDEDDDVEITVHNDMPRNATVHWHGIAQTGTPWSDGVIGLSQRPILPGESFVYRFKASPPGTHWYHSHERMSLEDGLYGAIFVRPKQNLKGLWSQISNDTKDIKAMEKAARNPKLMVLSEWTSFTSEAWWKAVQESGLLIFCVDSILLNGQGEAYCPPHEFLINQTNPGPKMTSFPDQNVTDKGCFPLTAPGIQGPWVHNSSDITKVPNHLQWGCIPSSGSNYTLEVDPADGWVSLNFIATQSNKQVDFSIDEHTMWLYEVDGAYVEPREFVAAAISSGERFSVMVKLDKTPARYTIRLPDSGATQVLSGFAEMVYKGAEHSTRQSIPYVTYGGMSALPITDTMSYTPYDLSSDTMTPWPPVAPAPVADEEFLLVMGRAGSTIKYTMNAKYLYPPDFKADRPMLFYPNDTLGTEDENLVIRTKNGSWVDLILQVASLPGDEMAFQHVMHKHGSKTWRIGSGVGPWKYSSVAEAIDAEPESFNLVNPGYRDTWMTVFATEPTGGYWTVYRYQVTDPGPWLFHCHFELHMMGGMSMAILDGVDAWPEVPPEYRLTKPSSNNPWKNILEWLRDLLDRLKGGRHSKA
ncbi:multicopper oxidase [Thermothelomyces thermophilus ATCC 42464]|uniref:Multicopper oxidase n=1 Tax=Thermothelomyces thermophilus (strain ATCC 42464 / BCRC 31852 / DSM 1799) TaxID=573729 RepID=G2QMK5_THET4|nr:multicopper oxidase [Thermothelomyces thermophilus ATCC 42464]AEO61185.1 multicopper oxidase [Thermothelomyces thermophilus ATCC 42464]